MQTDFFRQKIAAPERAKIIEQAIFDLHEVKLRLEARVVEGGAPPAEATGPGRAEPEDPLIAAGKALGGVVDDAE